MLSFSPKNTRKPATSTAKLSPLYPSPPLSLFSAEIELKHASA